MTSYSTATGQGGSNTSPYAYTASNPISPTASSSSAPGWPSSSSAIKSPSASTSSSPMQTASTPASASAASPLLSSSSSSLAQSLAAASSPQASTSPTPSSSAVPSSTSPDPASISTTISSTSNSSRNSLLITSTAAGVAAAVLALVLGAAGWWCCRRRSRKGRVRIASTGKSLADVEAKDGERGWSRARGSRGWSRLEAQHEEEHDAERAPSLRKSLGPGQSLRGPAQSRPAGTAPWCTLSPVPDPSRPPASAADSSNLPMAGTIRPPIPARLRLPSSHVAFSRRIHPSPRPTPRPAPSESSWSDNTEADMLAADGSSIARTLSSRTISTLGWSDAGEARQGRSESLLDALPGLCLSNGTNHTHIDHPALTNHTQIDHPGFTYTSSLRRPPRLLLRNDTAVGRAGRRSTVEASVLHRDHDYFRLGASSPDATQDPFADSTISSSFASNSTGPPPSRVRDNLRDVERTRGSSIRSSSSVEEQSLGSSPPRYVELYPEAG